MQESCILLSHKLGGAVLLDGSSSRAALKEDDALFLGIVEGTSVHGKLGSSTYEHVPLDMYGTTSPAQHSHMQNLLPSRRQA